MKTTLRDVAEAAGVSAMAVSAVLHGTGRNVKVSLEKAETIRRVAREMRYQPNRLARSLRNQRTYTVGVVFQHFGRLDDENPYYPLLLNGLTSALFPAGYTLALCPRLLMRGDAGNIADGRFDGVLWARPDFTEESVETLRFASIPVVMMHAPPGSVPGLPTFCADNEEAYRTVVDHLAGLGHRRVGFVIDPIDEPTAEGRARADACRIACSEAGLHCDKLVWTSDAPELAAYRSEAPHTALVTFSDTMAGHLLTACKRFGIRVPHELSIVGFDSSTFCETTSPRLTSVYQPVERMVYEATTHLLHLIEGDSGEGSAASTRSFLYHCGLDIRESTARPPSSSQRPNPC